MDSDYHPSREEPTSPTGDEMRIEASGSQSPDLGLQISRSRGLSEARQLLGSSERESLEDRVGVTKAFRYGRSPLLDDFEQRVGEGGGTYPQALKSGHATLRKDFLMFLVTLPLFALAGRVIQIDGELVTEYSQSLMNNCIQLTATLFPIIFSMIVGRAIYKFASWKLERGSSVGLLEQLIGCRTVSSTIFTQFKLWTNPLLGLSLVLLWLLSPVGSQAALRMLSTRKATITSTSSISYISTRQPVYSGNGYGSWFPGFVTLFSSSLVASPEVKSSPTDSWNNIKIPFLSSLSNFPMSQDGWRSLPTDGFIPDYSSIFGIPISDLPSGNTTFTLESTYLELSCSTRYSQKVRGQTRLDTFENPGLIATNGLFKSADNVTELTTWAIGYSGEDITPLLPSTSPRRLPCLDCLSINVDENKYSGLLLYQDFTGTTNATSIFCNPSQLYVESRIQCNTSHRSRSCNVTAQRESLLQHPPNKITLLAFSDVAVGLSKYLPNATDPIIFLDQIQNYLANPMSSSFIQSAPFPFLDDTSLSGESRVQNIPLEDFGRRFSQVINAFLYGSMWNSTMFLASANLADMKNWENGPSFIPALSPSELYASIQTGAPALTTMSSRTSLRTVFSASIPWLIFYLLPTLVILLSSLFSFVLSKSLVTPSYLGHVSTLARESVYISDQAKSDTSVQMGGLDRAREMREVRVKLGNVGNLKGGFEVGTGVEVKVGKMAVGGAAQTKGLKRERLYI